MKALHPLKAVFLATFFTGCAPGPISQPTRIVYVPVEQAVSVRESVSQSAQVHTDTEFQHLSEKVRKMAATAEGNELKDGEYRRLLQELKD